MQCACASDINKRPYSPRAQNITSYFGSINSEPLCRRIKDEKRAIISILFTIYASPKRASLKCVCSEPFFFCFFFSLDQCTAHITTTNQKIEEKNERNQKTEQKNNNKIKVLAAFVMHVSFRSTNDVITHCMRTLAFLFPIFIGRSFRTFVHAFRSIYARRMVTLMLIAPLLSVLVHTHRVKHRQRHTAHTHRIYEYNNSQPCNLFTHWMFNDTSML